MNIRVHLTKCFSTLKYCVGRRAGRRDMNEHVLTKQYKIFFRGIPGLDLENMVTVYVMKIIPESH